MGPLTRLLARRGRLLCSGKEKGFAGCLEARHPRRRPLLGRAAGRVRLVCRGFLPPSADARSVLPAVPRLPPPHLPPAEQKETHLAQKQTSSSENLCQAQVINFIETKCLLQQRGVHVLYLWCGSFQTKSVCHVLVLGTEFYLHHLGEPVPNEKNARQIADSYSAHCQGIQGREEQTKQMDVL